MEMPKPPSNLTPPIDMSRVRDEKGVKSKIKQLLNQHGWFTWMPGANGYGQQGVSDHLAIKDGVFLAIEAKFGHNKPTAVQKSFAAIVNANNCFAFCVNERNIDHLAWWLESFAAMVECQQKGEPIPDDHGARVLNAVAAMLEPFQ